MSQCGEILPKITLISDTELEERLRLCLEQRQMPDYLNRHGFQESAFYLSPDGNYLLTLVRKQPHF